MRWLLAQVNRAADLWVDNFWGEIAPTFLESPYS